MLLASIVVSLIAVSVMDSRDLSKNGTSQSSIPRHCSRIRGGMSRAVQLLRSILQFAQTMRSVSDLACHHKRVVADQLLLLIFRVHRSVTSSRITWEHVNPFEQLQAIGTLSALLVRMIHSC